MPVAIDQFSQRQQKDAEGDFWRKIANQSPRNDMNSTTQGLYSVTAEGELLAYTNNRGPWKLKAQLQEALKRHHPLKETKPLEVTKPDLQFQATPPKGTLIIRSHAKVLGGYEKTEDEWRKMFQNSVSRDNLWITPKEQEGLKRGEFLASLTQRLVRYHLIDNTRGEPSFWKTDDVKEANFTIQPDGKIQGTVHVARTDNSTGYEATLLGYLAFDGDRLTRFDLVAHGDYWGAGRYTRKPPKGKFPVGISFRIPTKATPFDLIAPQGTKGWMDPYLFTAGTE